MEVVTFMSPLLERYTLFGYKKNTARNCLNKFHFIVIKRYTFKTKQLLKTPV